MNTGEPLFLPPLPPVLEVRINERGPAWLRAQVGRMVSRPFREPIYDRRRRLTGHCDDPRRSATLFHLLGYGPTEAAARAMAEQYEQESPGA